MLFDCKKAVIIGETRLCTQCAEYLIENNWKILCMVSDDKVVSNWSKNHAIMTLPIAQLDTIEENNFYLFSIINPYLIPEHFLINKKVSLAINYHDSLLPKYAGVNSTTWAIINNEKIHGITLHLVTPGIDEGEIAAQSKINIEEDETAISLNLKCSEALLSLFPEVVTKIETMSLVTFKQNLANKTYYGLKEIPQNYGIINGVKDLETLYRMVRGLTFGDGYDNQVASVKVFLNNNFYIVEDFNVNLLINPNSLNDESIIFSKTSDIYGNVTNQKITYGDISTKYILTKNDLHYLSNIKALERKNKRKLLDFFGTSEASIKILDGLLRDSEHKDYITETVIPKDIGIVSALTLVYILLARFFRDDFIISLYISDETIPANLRGLIEYRNFIRIQKEALNNDFASLENNLKQSYENYYTLVKDFSYRFNIQSLTDIAVVIGKVETIDKHKITIRIDNGTLEIKGNGFYQLQISSIEECIKTLFSKYLQNEITNKDLKTISLLNDAQYQQIVYEWNKTEKPYPREKTIHQLFEEQVEKTPNNIAVVYEDAKLTYQELNHKANQLAHYLLNNHKVKPDDLIVLCLDRNEYMLIAMLAALKAGGAYVPIEPGYPDERIGYILENTKSEVVLNNYIYKNRMQKIIEQKQGNMGVIAIDEKNIQNKLSRQSNTNPITQTKSNNLVYVIYTSGTTGSPKGVMIEHKSVVNYVTYLINDAKLDDKSIGSQYARFSFDASVTEIYPILLSGGALYIIKEEDRMDVAKVNEFFNQHHITYAFLPTKFAELFFSLKNSSLINLVVGGEQLEKFSNQTYRVINAYGPTETTVQPTIFIVDKPYKNIPIGKPINNVKCYVVDNNLNLLPMGIIGELVIGGECLFRGYYNLSELIKRSFVSNTFQTESEKSKNINSRLYKTGDLVRILSDGNIEYIGRNDFQVKIRGYRIELNEIEKRLSSYSGVKQAVVLVKDRTIENARNKYLVAYYVASKELDEKKIQNYLAEQLPEYMLPTALVYVKDLPVTINGKLDRKALPEPKFENKDAYIAPKNEQEQLICEAFEKILGIKKISATDDFFKLGGNSLQAIQLVAILQTNFDVKVADIFNLRTPSKLAKNSYFGKNMLRQKLEQIKLVYNNKTRINHIANEQLQKKIDLYLQDISNFQVDCALRKSITNVLLTGATGYLGCNLLNQLLKLTNYNVFLLIRANSKKEAIERINKKFQFYFDRALADVCDNRVFIIKADLEKNSLGLSPEEYINLATKIDSIIHAAASVKHYGEYDRFYSANVQATINLLEFTKLTKHKDFHYISTCSVLNYGFVPNYDEYTYTEDDLPDNLQQWDNVYVQTKFRGEQEVVKCRSYGINSNIYRVGNLAFIAENGRAQENVGDNAFFNWLKCLFKMSYVAQDLNLVEISPVDLTARAIVKLFDKQQLINHNYHVFNPHLFDLSDVVGGNQSSPIVTLTMEQFVDNIAHNLNNDIYHDLIVKFLLRQGWLDGWGIEKATSIKILQNRTQLILGQLGFKWLPISSRTFNKYLKLLNLYGANEMASKAKILKYLETISKILPTPVYWLDLNQKYLGINDLVVKASGTESYDEDFAGKTPYDVYPREMAEEIVQHHKEVIRTGKILSAEESIRDVTTGETKYFNATIAPLRDDDEKIIGTIGTSIDITAEKKETERAKRAKVFEHLERISQLLPTPIYWFDLNQKYLGINDLVVKASGTESYDEDFAGKTPYDVYPREMAEEIVQHHKEVIRTGKILSAEESIRDVTTNQVKYFNAFIAPLRDDDGKIIGTIGTSIDITTEKEAERLVFKHLERIVQLLPTPIYWFDLNQKYLGINELVVKGTGTRSYDEDFAGKTPYDLFPKKMAKEIVQHHQEVISTGKILSAEESIRDITTNNVKHFNAFIAPLHDDYGKIIGTIGTSIDITAEKEAARLKFENELQKAKLEEHEQFAKIAKQVAHDIGAPMTSLSTFLKTISKDLPELTRISLRNVHTRIMDISNNLSSKYKEEDKEAHDRATEIQPFLVSLALSQLLTEKKYQFMELPVTFNCELNQASHFAFIETEPVAFKRMISNLINNSVEAFEGKPGEVNLTVNTDHSLLKIIIEDNGKGITPKVLKKIRDNVSVTSDKKGGSGIGLVQVSETLQRCNAEFVIESTVGKGTKITLTFLRTVPPEWIADEICVNRGDTVVILDDDSSIHGAWDVRFKDYSDAVKLQHFTFGEDAVAFINAADKDKIFLLADFELLKQKLNGIDVIERTQIQRSILVTSHFDDRAVRDLASKSNTKILPKQLASEITIEIVAPAAVAATAASKDIDVVVVEDDKILADGLAKVLRLHNKKVDVYYSGKKFLKTFTQYSKDTKFSIDYRLDGITGMEVAEKLHEAGYTQLYLFTGWDFNSSKVPNYLTILTKGDTDKVVKALTEETAITTTKPTIATVATITTDSNKASVVIIEDHKILADNLAASLEGDSDRIVDIYYDGSKFLKKFTQYSKDTKFCIDHSLGGKVTGLDITKKLYEAGYPKLFLVSGWEFDRSEVPGYVTIVKKRDVQDIIKALEEGCD